MDLWLQSMMKFIFSYANLLALLLKPNNIKIKERLRIAMIEPIFVKNTTTTTTTTTTITTTTTTTITTTTVTVTSSTATKNNMLYTIKIIYIMVKW